MKKISYVVNIVLVLFLVAISWPRITDFKISELPYVRNIYQCGKVILSPEMEYGGLVVRWVTIPHSDFKVIWNGVSKSWDFSIKDENGKWVTTRDFDNDITIGQDSDVNMNVECDGSWYDSELIDVNTFGKPIRLPSIDEDTTNIDGLRAQLIEVLPGSWSCEYGWHDSNDYYNDYQTGKVKIQCKLNYIEYYSTALEKTVGVEAVWTDNKITNYIVSIVEYVSNPGSSGVCSDQVKGWIPFTYKTVYVSCGEEPSTDAIMHQVYGENQNLVLQEIEDILGSLTYEGIWTWQTDEYNWKYGNWDLKKGSLVPVMDN